MCVNLHEGHSLEMMNVNDTMKAVKQVNTMRPTYITWAGESRCTSTSTLGTRWRRRMSTTSGSSSRSQHDAAHLHHTSLT
mmetsp:Transcript_15019/g.36722  ORF Transcript_15019/g.36722 Transcript_15019/m.36722 type:complete len:80 (-) Transcript_15019:307-546(-)